MINQEITHGNLTDDYIINKLTKGRNITSESDFNLKNGSKSTDKLELSPIANGLYDGKVFGSMFPDRCNCGLLRIPGQYCAACSSKILPEAERFTRYGAYFGIVYYSNNIRLDVMKERLYQLFDEVRIDLSNSENVFMNHKGGVDWQSIFNLAQFQVEEASGRRILVITDDLTDESKVSLEGVRSVIQETFPQHLDEFNGYMNKVIPILPVALRPVRLTMFEGRKKAEISRYTIMYRSIIHITRVYTEKLEVEDNIYIRTLLKASLRSFIGNQLYAASDISKGSRGNFFRTSYQNRVAGSGRGVIVPDTKLKITEVGIPFHLAYEMYKTEFIAYIENTYLTESKRDAIELYKSASTDILNLFEEFVEELDKHVIFNRNPTLHKYNILTMKVKLTRDSAIHVPQLIVELVGGDFDGDEMNFFAIPNDLKDYAVKHNSPKNMVYYESDHSFLFKFNHESLNGLIISSKVIVDGEPKHYVSFEDLEKDFNDAVIEVDTALTFEDDILTSYGRLKIGQIIQIDVNALIGDSVPFNAKNVSELYALLAKYEPEVRVGIYQQLQEFVLEMVYLSGETTLSLEEIYVSTDDALSNKVKEIANREDLTDSEKVMTIEQAHEAYIKNYMNSMDGKLAERISESSRMKINSYLDMITPQMIIKPDSKVYVSEHTQLDGLSEYEMIEHSLNNRKLLASKFKSVPVSGYMGRQMGTMGQSLVLKPGEDKDNLGIKLPRNRVEGRTMTNGKLVSKSSSDELVNVRSILTSNFEYLTPDMISTFNTINYDVDGVDHKGVAFMISIAETTTQKGLSVKHGGRLRLTLTENTLIANDNCTLELFDKYFTLTYADNYVAKFPRTHSMVFNRLDSYSKGALVCQLSKINTFSYTLDSVMTLCKAMGRVSLPDLKNKITMQRCVALNRGKITYDFESGLIDVAGDKVKIQNDTMYYLPDGEEVEFADKFCSGIENVSSVMSNYSYTQSYSIFRNQFRHIMPHISEEIIESLFYLITNRTENTFVGVLQTNKKNPSLAPNLAFGYPKSGIERAIKGISKLKADTYTNSLITPFLVSDMMNAINKRN